MAALRFKTILVVFTIVQVLLMCHVGVSRAMGTKNESFINCEELNMDNFSDIPEQCQIFYYFKRWFTYGYLAFNIALLPLAIWAWAGEEEETILEMRHSRLQGEARVVKNVEKGRELTKKVPTTCIRRSTRGQGDSHLMDGPIAGRTRSKVKYARQKCLFEDDVLTPYLQGQHGPKHSHRVTRDCQGVQYGNLTHEAFPSYSPSELQLPLMKTNRFLDRWQITENLHKDVYGHITIINNPARTVSVLEPQEIGGCNKNLRASVEDTAKQKNCLVAMNAGFFNTHTGACLGNIVSDGRIVLDSNGIQNAHFGIKKDGTLFFGYLSEAELLDEVNPFTQLVGGVGWVIRNGETYVNASKYIECQDTEETGTVDQFFRVVSARSVVGHDKTGRLLFIQIDGKTWEKGTNLFEFADFLHKLGIVNAINLDGGGSATYVVNGTTVNYPTDICEGSSMYRCDRPVSTVLCVHEPECDPVDCSNHGHCVLGQCSCHDSWTGDKCDLLQCGAANCSGQGNCTENGCICNPGWIGSDCTESCPDGFYGVQCHAVCQCEHGECDPISGQCTCQPGYTGILCDRLCSYGYYGDSCQHLCQCGDTSCSCHPISGSCNMSYLEVFDSSLHQASKCIANGWIKEKHLVPTVPLDNNYFFIGLCVCAVMLLVSVVGIFFLVCCRCTCTCSSRPTLMYHRLSGSIPDEEDDSEEILMNDLSLKR
ncbi:N-acetylglucosamine-1-phosphodiester alpha-N-acetylglucosaminidase-like [Glandiceps talaboti]